ncbi:MAG TPA: carboxypeptidase regulatory-like domain-containing protein [Chitinophagaceae bacterium]|nr:carboxypeptidase regulatory-like domain-containing protein [Chitinophagaceae bacterium]
MKQKIQLQLHNPCNEDWNNMTPTGQGRYCLSCKKEVVDFASMSDVEIIQYIANAQHQICGRVEESQLQRNIAPTVERRPPGLKYLWSLVLGSALLTNKAGAQSAPLKAPAHALPVKQQKEESLILLGAMSTNAAARPLRITGIVTDTDGQPIPYASVLLTGTNQGVATDSVGRFVLDLPNPPADWQLQISSVGFVPATVAAGDAENIESINAAKGRLALSLQTVQLAHNMLQEVVVKLPPQCSNWAGGLSSGIRITRIQKAAIQFKDFAGINEIKAFPNPIAPNSLFTLRLQLKTKGEYVVQFTDAGGRIIASRPLSIVSGNQTLQLNSNMLGAAGIYFASITNRQTLQTYTTRLLLQ